MFDTKLSPREALITQLFASIVRFKKTTAGIRVQCPGAVLNGSQLGVIMATQRLQPVSAQEIAQHLGLTPGAVSQLLDSLEPTGFIARAPNPEDRRSQLLSLTARGAEAVTHFESKRYELIRSAMKDFADDDIRTIIRAHDAILGTLEKDKHITTVSTKP